MKCLWTIGVPAWALASLLYPSLCHAADPSAKDALSDAISPVQKDVDYARAKADEIADCRVQSAKEDGWAGWYVLNPAGDKLRRFADTNNDKQIDLWCYYLGHRSLPRYRFRF
ncbi:MAG: hypothetical protein R3C05_00835 [Pirellulaceae bacterium]